MEKFYVQEDGFAKDAYDDFKGTMEKLAKMGYSGIEIYYGLHGGLQPAEMKDFMESIGMEVVGSHVDLENTDEQLKYLPGTGCKYIICPGFMHLETMDEVMKAAAILNENGRKAKEVGMKYGYHNHAGDFSYIDGKMVNDVLIENTDPDLVAFEIDLAWAWRGGTNATEYISKNADRVELIHVKETKEATMPKMPRNFPKNFKMERTPWGLPVPDPKRPMNPSFMAINCQLGKGLIDMPAVMAAFAKAGKNPYCVVERDYAWTGDIWTTLAHDAGYLSAI